jgi:hypothetical protein
MLTADLGDPSDATYTPACLSTQTSAIQEDQV